MTQRELYFLTNENSYGRSLSLRRDTFHETLCITETVLKNSIRLTYISY